MVRATLPFVGRQRELATLRELCADASAAVVVGAAGLGKSRLIAEICADDTLTCVIGIGAAELQTSPYAAFRTLALRWRRLLDPASLGWSDQQLRNLGPVFPAFQPSNMSDEQTTEGQHQRLWLSLLRYLDALVALHPNRLVLVLEDLHVVDASSLKLFAWLCSQPLEMSMVATARPAAPDLVAKLPTIVLHPLGLTAIEAIQRGTSPALVDSQTLLGLTGGVPLRLHEWVLGASVSGSAHAHGALLEQLLDGCRSSTLDALRLTAVFPGMVDSALLATVLAVPESSVVEALADAAARGVISQGRGALWTFDDDGYRVSLLESLDHAQRRSCERRLVHGLRDEVAARPELLGHLAALATNLGEDRIDAAELHLAAGQYALGQRAVLVARDHFEAAVELAGATNTARLTLQASLALALVLAALSDTETSVALAKVYPLAEAQGDGDAFASAALAEPIGLGHIGTPMMTDHRAVARLRSARSLVTDPGLRARVLAALAVQQHSSLREHQYFRLVEQAQDIASQLSDTALDGQILAARLGTRRSIGSSVDLEDSVQSYVDGLEPFDPNALPIVDIAVMLACRCGDLGTAEDLIRRYETEFAPLPALAQWSVLRARTAIAFARGSIEVARSLSLQALEVTKGSRLDAVALEHFAFQIAAMLRERRKMSDARPTVETWVVEHPTHGAFRASRAWLYADLGDLAGARSDLEVFFAQDLVELRSSIDGPLSISMAICAAFVVGGDDIHDWCAQGYELLQPLADEWLLVGLTSLIEGPVVRVMALASSALGETDRALAENAEAQRRAQEAGALLFVWHALRDRGLILRAAGRIDEAQAALNEAANRYRSAGLNEQADWVQMQLAELDAGHATGAPVVADATESRGLFRRDHRVWHVGLDDETAICRHLKGMPMIAALLGAPDRAVAAGVLAAIGDGNMPTPEHAAIRAASAQTIVDDEAVASYRRRLDEIVGELDRADRRGDAGASGRLTTEFEAITVELATTHGLGGRRRVMTSEDERARVRVNKAIRSAIRRIAEQAPGLALHLDRSIDTGLFCSYRMGSLRQVDWTLS